MKKVTAAAQAQKRTDELGIQVINLSEIQVNDQFLLRTQNSLYRFLVTSAGTVRGRLLRGEQVISSAEVELVGSSDAQSSNTQVRGQTLQVGSRAVFQVIEQNNKQRLLTSPIINLSLVKADDENTDRFNSKTWGDDTSFEADSADDMDDREAVDSMFVKV